MNLTGVSFRALRLDCLYDTPFRDSLNKWDRNLKIIWVAKGVLSSDSNLSRYHSPQCWSHNHHLSHFTAGAHYYSIAEYSLYGNVFCFLTYIGCTNILIISLFGSLCLSESESPLYSLSKSQLNHNHDHIFWRLRIPIYISMYIRSEPISQILLPSHQTTYDQVLHYWSLPSYLISCKAPALKIAISAYITLVMSLEAWSLAKLGTFIIHRLLFDSVLAEKLQSTPIQHGTQNARLPESPAQVYTF